MFHWVREVVGTPFPYLPVLTPDRFDKVLNKLADNYRPISAGTLVDFLAGGAQLPPRPCLLTFDDGFLEHFQLVLPRLQARGWSACFYPLASASWRGELPQVHQTQLILGSRPAGQLLETLGGMLKQCPGSYSLEAARACLPQGTSRWDGPERSLLKWVFRGYLPPRLREQVLGELFQKLLGPPEDLAPSIYMNWEHMEQMLAGGMHLGGHSLSHPHLAGLDEQLQRREIEASLAMLDRLGARDDFWSFSYPYGSNDDTTRAILADYGCSFALTTRPVSSRQDSRQPLALRRLDVNDLLI